MQSTACNEPLGGSFKLCQWSSLVDTSINLIKLSSLFYILSNNRNTVRVFGTPKKHELDNKILCSETNNLWLMVFCGTERNQVRGYQREIKKKKKNIYIYIYIYIFIYEFIAIVKAYSHAYIHHIYI